MSDERNVHAGHRERLKAEFIETPESFNSIRILELLLTYAIPRKDTNPVAHALLDRFGSLRNVLSASADELKTVDGIGENAATLIRLVSEINRMNLQEQSRSGRKGTKRITSTDAAGKLAAPYFANERDEKFLLFCLDSGKRLIKASELGRGVVNSVIVDVRKTVETALNAKSSSVIIAHNHPDGELTPSEEDKAVTMRLAAALGTVGITLLDHIIVSDEGFLSFAFEGLMQQG